MALYLKVSNSLEDLSKNVSRNLQQSRNNAFESYFIVTQTEGMNNWLKLQIAEHIGIAANCRFLKPNDLICQLYYNLGGRYNETLSIQSLTWILYALLGEKDFADRFPEVAEYFQNSVHDRDMKRMGLAEKVADLFDQYQIYRTEMIRQWNTGDLEIDDKNEWQQYLWIKAKHLSKNALPDKTLIGQHILEALKDPQQRIMLSKKMASVHLFGLSIITSYHIQILYELSAFIDVHIYAINPAPAVYWFEDRSEKQLAAWKQKGDKNAAESTVGNTLLASWGRVVQDTFGLFFTHDEFINAYDDAGVTSPVPDSLLHKIQYDIYHNATTDRNRLPIHDICDGTVTINSCYTVAREVEVLYNYLVYLIDKKQESLSPRDIVVMVSDIDAYAPYIKAVFDHAPYKFPYTIADESYTDNDNLFNALQAILQLNEDNFKADTVIQLLDYSYIRNRFSITDVELIRKVVDKANIRFGIDGKQNDDTFLVSWNYGLKRIMYGICMSASEEYGKDANSFYPVDILEGSNTKEIIKFCHFVEMLIFTVQEQKHNRVISDWAGYLENVLHNMVYEPQEDIDEDYSAFMSQFVNYNTLNEYVKDVVSFEVFSHNFLQTLAHTKRSGLFGSGGVTFCSLIPMRSIPFKVVALMGLNYDKFPRRDQPVGFNLMNKNRQRGDRNVKENDKHLFLETILSARKYLYISYIGQSAKDNTGVPPSALIDEFIDYIEEGAENPKSVLQNLITVHPLQGFSHKYNRQNNCLYNYLNTGSAPAKFLLKAPKEEYLLSDKNEIAINDLVRFFKHPFKFYYNNVLGIYYNDEQVLLSETEFFSMDSLQQWTIKNELLSISPDAVAGFKTQLLKTGVLPLKNMATVAFESIVETVQPVRKMHEQCTKGKELRSIPVELSIDNNTLCGVLHNVFDDKLVQVSWSKNECKYQIEAYISYLAGVATGALKGMNFISSNKDKIYEAASLTKEDALLRLSSLVRIYQSGLLNIVPFYPDFGITPKDVAKIDSDNFEKMVEGLIGRYEHPLQDPYIIKEYQNGFFNDKYIGEQYKSVCEEIIVPLAEVFQHYYK